jgi:hypothetical protein
LAARASEAKAIARKKCKEDTAMKLSAAVGVGLLTLLLGVPAAVYAQDEPKQDEPKQEEPKSDKDNAKPSKQDNAKPSKEEDSTHSSKTSQMQSQTDQTQTTKSAGKGGHIPDNQFKAHFGRSHTFVVNQTVIVQGQPRFQYGGYWFALSEAWPGGWAYTDQCYIDYVDGEYILYDLLHPGVTVVLVVVM